MAYTTLDGVRVVLPQNVEINDTTSYPLQVTVESWIVQVSGQVDLAMEAGGEAVPASGTPALEALKMLCSREVAYQVMVTRGSVEDPKNQPLWKGWHKEFMDALELMRKGTYVASLGVGGLPWSPTMDAATAEDARKLPVFERDMDL